MVRRFDLNIDKILEAWEPAHAIRELIANALDEQALTATQGIQVYEDRENEWVIRDFGRGLSIEHLIQTENPEKIAATSTIGKFGVGLKDALATLWRHNIQVDITSRHGRISLERSSKHAFEELLTLHACVEPSPEAEMTGTKIRLLNCQRIFVEKAKEMFVVFRDREILENTQYGQVLLNQQDQASIYLNGLKIAAEENFLFSYNITSPNAAIRKELNRERTNVGRAAYSDRIKSMLLSCQSTKITDALSRDLQLLNNGHNHDELGWLEVQAHACLLLQAQQNVVFVTAEERTEKPALIGYAQTDGLTAVTIPERLKAKVSAQSTNRDEPVNLLSAYAQSFNESFKYDFVTLQELSPQEQQVFQLADDVFCILGGKPPIVKQILISLTMRPEDHIGFNADGIWQPGEGRIVIKRSALLSRERFLGILLHELAHALSGAADVSLAFESKLTELLGKVANAALRKNITLLPSELDKNEPGQARQSNDLDAFWSELMSNLQRTHLPTFTLISQFAFPLSLSDGELVIGVLKENFQKMIEGKVDQIKTTARNIRGRELSIKVRVAKGERAELDHSEAITSANVLDLNNIDVFWSAVMDNLSQSNKSSSSLISQFSFPLALTENELVIGVLKESFIRMIKIENIKRAARNVSGKEFSIIVKVTEREREKRL